MCDDWVCGVCVCCVISREARCAVRDVDASRTTRCDVMMCVCVCVCVCIFIIYVIFCCVLICVVCVVCV